MTGHETPAVPTITVPFSHDELWLIRDSVRRHNEYGLVWSRQEMRKVHRAIMAIEAAISTANERGGPAPESWDLELDLDTLWQIEQQVPRSAVAGPKPVGLLVQRKVMAAMTALEDRIAAGDGSYPITLSAPIADYLRELNDSIPDAGKGG